MSERTKAATRIVIVVVGVLAAIALAQFVAILMLGQFLAVNAQGGYTIDSLRGGGVYLAIANLAALATIVLLTALIVKIVYRRSAIDRVLIILGGYACACVGAGLALALIYLLHSVRTGYGPLATGPVEHLIILYMMTLFFSACIAVFALPATLAVIIYTEQKSVCSPVFYGVAGTLAALAGYGVYLSLLAGGGPTSTDSMLAGWIFAPPGVVGGLTYWVIAGRKAGDWDEAPALPAGF